MTAPFVAAGSILLAYAAAVMVVAPRGITRRRWTSRAPRAAISLWVAALGSGGLAMVASMVCAVVAASRMASQHAMPLTRQTAAAGIAVSVLAFAMTAFGGGLGCLVFYRLLMGFWDRQELLSPVARQLATPVRDNQVEVTIVHSDTPAALSMPGRRPAILVSTGLEAALTPEELEAVVEHERGHLLQRHHLLVGLADLQYKCAPILPCARSLERSIHVLVELAADDHAAHRCGRDVTATALRALGAATGDVAMELRAQRLEIRHPHPFRGARRVSRASASDASATSIHG